MLHWSWTPRTGLGKPPGPFRIRHACLHLRAAITSVKNNMMNTINRWTWNEQHKVWIYRLGLARVDQDGEKWIVSFRRINAAVTGYEWEQLYICDDVEEAKRLAETGFTREPVDV